MSRETLSQDSITKATKSRAKKSDHGGAGAGGYTQAGMDNETRSIDGDITQNILNFQAEGSRKIRIGLGWNNIIMQQAEGLFSQLIKKIKKTGVDLDLGCLYELKNGDRGCLQAFGEMYGSYSNAPFIKHAGDERTGDSEGLDEEMFVNGDKWDEIERILVYCYIYDGPQVWEKIIPDVCVTVPGHEAVHFKLTSYKDTRPICALVSLKNENGGIALQAHAEYYRGHPDMDRAFGFGLNWEEGEKS